jgi:hypothetical protein
LAELSTSVIRINELAALLKDVVDAGVLLQQPVVQSDGVAVGSLLFPVIATCLWRTLMRWYHDGFV